MNNPNINLTQLINQLTLALKKGAVEASYHEKLVARLLLLKAWHDICNEKKNQLLTDNGNYYSSPNMLNDFLKALVANNLYNMIENCFQEWVLFTGIIFGKAYVKFSHFVSITYTSNRKHL